MRPFVLVLALLPAALGGQALPPSTCLPPDAARAVRAVQPIDPTAPVALIDGQADNASAYPDPPDGVFAGHFLVRFVTWGPAHTWREDTTYFTLTTSRERAPIDSSAPPGEGVLATGWVSVHPSSVADNRRRITLSKSPWVHLSVSFDQPEGMEDAPSLRITAFSDNGFQGWEFAGAALSAPSIRWFCAERF